MPDPEQRTVSASQVGMLFNVSRWGTRYLLYHHFASGLPLDDEETERMGWGKRLQGAILEAAAEELTLRVDEAPQEYQRHPEAPIGATPDGWVFDPSLGWGVVEAKNVDALMYRDQWSDEMAPKEVELQVQTQMDVGGLGWGVIAALVGGNQLVLYHREPNPDLQWRIRQDAADFLDRVADGRAPEPFGSPLEIPALDWLYPEVDEDKEIEGDADFADLARQLDWARQRRLDAEKVEKQLKPKVLDRAGDAGRVWAPGAAVRIKKSQTPAKEEPPDVTQEARRVVEAYGTPQMEGAIRDLDAALHQPNRIVRKAATRTTIEVEQSWETDAGTGVGTDYLATHEALYSGGEDQ